MKTIFIAFAIEDEEQRDFLKEQSLNTDAPFRYIYVSNEETHHSMWSFIVKMRIKQSDGVIVLVSENSLNSTSQKWEIQCAREEGLKIIGIYAYNDDRTGIVGVETKVWTLDILKDFINSC